LRFSVDRVPSPLSFPHFSKKTYDGIYVFSNLMFSQNEKIIEKLVQQRNRMGFPKAWEELRKDLEALDDEIEYLVDNIHLYEEVSSQVDMIFTSVTFKLETLKTAIKYAEGWYYAKTDRQFRRDLLQSAERVVRRGANMPEPDDSFTLDSTALGLPTIVSRRSTLLGHPRCCQICPVTQLVTIPRVRIRICQVNALGATDLAGCPPFLLFITL